MEFWKTREPLSFRMRVATKSSAAAVEVKKICVELDSFSHLASNVKITYEVPDLGGLDKTSHEDMVEAIMCAITAINFDFTCDEVEDFYMIHDDMYDKFDGSLLTFYVDPVNERIQQY